MGQGWEEPSSNEWQPPISEPKATSWEVLTQYLGKSRPRDARPPELRRQQKTKVRRRDEYKCRRRSCSSKFDLSSPKGELWVEGERRKRRPRNQSRADFIGECLHVHHIIKCENGGRNVPSNLITLYERCHVRLHEQSGEQVPEWEQFFGVGGNGQDFFGW